MPDNQVLFLRLDSPALGRESQLSGKFLCFNIVEMCDAAETERVSRLSIHDYKQLMEQNGKAWTEQRQKEKARKQIDVQDNVEHYAANLVQRISDPASRGNDKHTQLLNKKIGNEIQSNICSICLQLMIPPLRNPIILFPCGHNICKDCLFERPPQGQLKKNLKLKLDKCSLCRQKIESYAVNQSLMTLICTYSNNKHLIELENKRLKEEEEGSQEDGQSHEQLKVRCNILEKEIVSLSNQNEQYTRSKLILGQVVETLRREKKKVEKQMQKVEEEGGLINKCLVQKIEQLEFLDKNLKEAQDRSRVIGKALQPLLKEKEKQEFLLMEKLLSKR